MRSRIIIVFVITFVTLCTSSESVFFNEGDDLLPTVFIAFAVRNKAHVLPYFLSSLQALDYPKNRITLWIKSDHNEDSSNEIIRSWLDHTENEYHSVTTQLNDDKLGYKDEKSTFDWSDGRFNHIINLKERAFFAAKRMWADYIWFLDCDIIFNNRKVLKDLISEEKTVIAPMLNTFKLYSNFWGAMDDDFYYKRSPDYLSILNRKLVGVHNVTLVHSAVLVNLRKEKSRLLSFNPQRLTGVVAPNDDIIAFALSCSQNGVQAYVMNREDYGYLPVPLEVEDELQSEIDQISEYKVHSTTYGKKIDVSSYLVNYVKVKEANNMGFDQIYLINLKRRSERKERMLSVFEELGLSVQVFEAIDGKKLNSSFLEDHKINELPEYIDPYHDRKMKFGEIGCFLSHYKIWQEIIKNKYNRVLIFEDDARFKPSFRKNFLKSMDEAQLLTPDWDLMYLGRKILTTDEVYVSGSTTLVDVSYSHWSLAYALTFNGAKILVNEDPLVKIIPIDEYLPIMYNRHPRTEWSSHYNNRELKAVGIYPVVVEPSHYVGQPGYITDTEDSDITNLKKGDNTSAKDEL